MKQKTRNPKSEIRKNPSVLGFGFRIWDFLLLAILLLLLVPSSLVPARDKPEVLGESGRTARRLQEIADKEKMARDKPSEERWTEVVDELQALLTSAGSDLVPTEDGRCVPVRWVCHARLAGLPKAVLARYRLRIERQAQQW